MFPKGRSLAALVRFIEKVGEGRGDVVLVEQLTRGQGITIVDTGIGRRTANN